MYPSKCKSACTDNKCNLTHKTNPIHQMRRQFFYYANESQFGILPACEPLKEKNIGIQKKKDEGEKQREGERIGLCIFFQ